MRKLWPMIERLPFARMMRRVDLDFLDLLDQRKTKPLTQPKGM